MPATNHYQSLPHMQVTLVASTTLCRLKACHVHRMVVHGWIGLRMPRPHVLWPLKFFKVLG